MVSNDIYKKEYEAPRFKFINVQFQGIVCQSVLEPIEEGSGHDW